jgi:hypothetical protein
MPAWVRGAYDGKIRLPIKGIRDEDEPILRKLIYHEYVHAMGHSITPDCPLWVNEGLAEYFSEDSPGDIGQVIPLSELEKSFPMEGGRKTHAAYRESHAAVTDLIEEYGIYSMKEFLVYLSEGRGLPEAFSSAFFISYEEFLSGWGKGPQAGR